MRILVSGAGGFVGRHLVPHLRANGHEVVALARGAGASTAPVFAGPADLAEIEGFPDWPAGIEAIVHLAALNPSRREAASRDADRLRRANAEATAALARRAAREGVRRMVFLGSSAVHAPAGARAVAESQPLHPESPYAASKAEAEAAFGQALAGAKTEGIVLRPAPVFGPGAGNLTALLARLARTPLPLPLGGLGAARSLLSVDGLVEAIRLALSLPVAASRTFLVADDEPLAPADIVAALRQGRGRRPLLLPAPLRLAGDAARLLGRGDMLAGAGRGLVIDTGRIRETLGWRPQNARKALEAMAANGRL